MERNETDTAREIKEKIIKIEAQLRFQLGPRKVAWTRHLTMK